MANHKSAIKRARQNQDRMMRNRSYKTRIKNVVKKVLATVEEKSPEGAREALVKAQAVISRGAARGIIHKNTASRKISRLARKVASLG